ncbi:hypothetical protein BGX27_003999 [Mortierella sp. AM989]|nr:hypothetical protein BGX27_003999 [Mortierella sp. AM989]
MRISNFIPAVLGLALFTASTQALPAPYEQEAVALLKRDYSDVVKKITGIFLEAHVDVYAKAKVDLQADVCAAINVDLRAEVGVLGLGLVKVDVKDLEIKAKIEAEIEAKALIDAYIDLYVFGKISGHVHKVVGSYCPMEDSSCLHRCADDIVTDIVLLINADYEIFITKLKVDIDLKVKARVKAYIEEVCIDLGLVRAAITAVVTISLEIELRLKAFVQVCISLFAKAAVVLAIKAM